ncbi:MAG: M15 family metallopeptidase [Deltaproteobacteria bacterium]|nr:M15 family metallopeptidase [Deltaproteobacteria bacterium]
MCHPLVAITPLAPRGLGLLVYDCYRPQRAVDDFAAWAKDESQQEMKAEFYPQVPRGELFKRGYLAHKSGHSVGNTLDLTLISLDGSTPPPQKQADCQADALHEMQPETQLDTENEAHILDVGTPYDCFSPFSATSVKGISKEAKQNRDALRKAMEKQGFRNYKKEWWHYSLSKKGEKRTFHDFAVRQTPYKYRQLRGPYSQSRISGVVCKIDRFRSSFGFRFVRCFSVVFLRRACFRCFCHLRKCVGNALCHRKKVLFGSLRG